MQTQSSEILKKIPKKATVSNVGNDAICPVCGGSGYVLYLKTVEGYDAPLEYARLCTACQFDRRKVNQTGVPSMYQGLTLEDFDFKAYGDFDLSALKKISEHFVEHFDFWKGNGKGLFLWSHTPGSGKTLLASILAQIVSVKQDISMRFITAPDYLAAVGESYKVERGQIDPSKIYRDVKLLVLDDVGAQKTGDWQKQEIFRLVNERLNAGKVTIFTSNMEPVDLNLDERTINRIKKISVVIQLPEISVRSKVTNKEQDDFLNRVLKI